MKKIFTGFDIGTDSVKAVATDGQQKIVYVSDNIIHFGNPWDALSDLYSELTTLFTADITCAFTGSGGQSPANKMGVPFIHDTISIPAGAALTVPDARYIFHAGAKDSYFFENETTTTTSDGSSILYDHATGTKCGGGSGIMLTKQCRRFFENEFPIKTTGNRTTDRHLMQHRLDAIFQKAESEARLARNKIDVGGRCGVVIQSDMIHLQNKGAPVREILYGLFRRTVMNYKADVLNKRFLDPKAKKIVSGGLFKNRLLVEILETILETSITIPESFYAMGATGAALKAEKQGRPFLKETLSSIYKDELHAIKTVSPLSTSLKQVAISSDPDAIAHHGCIKLFCKPDPADPVVILGIDGGSTTTKCIAIHPETLTIMAEACIYTNGAPLEAARTIFTDLKNACPDLIVKGTAYTGSSGEFYKTIFSGNGDNLSDTRQIDCVRDEITCHGLGVRHYNKQVDTIFELGGQDAKYTLFNSDGTVSKSKMNLSCMAGTGQTMQNMVEMIGLDINTDFHDYALKASRTPVVDDTCGVFTEAGIARLIALGLPREEIAAAIAYGFMGGYVNKFIGNEKFGGFASAQGGPFNGTACLAALAMHTDMPIHAFPHRQLFGALGAALAVCTDIKECEKTRTPYQSSFRGFDLMSAPLEKSDINCSQVIGDSCEEKDCLLEVYKLSGEILVSGGACPKGNTEKKQKKAPNYTALYKTLLNKHLADYSTTLTETLRLKSSNKRVFIPRSLTFLNEMGVFYSALYNTLGFDVVLSPESNDTIAGLGIDYAHSETCYPVKIAHGHGAFLKSYLRPGQDKLLLVNAIGTNDDKYKFCPYVAGAGFLIKDAIGMDNQDVLLPALVFGKSIKTIAKSFFTDLKRVFKTRFSMAQVITAVKKAYAAEAQFQSEIQATGSKLLTKLKENKVPVFMGIGRGYTLLDKKAGSNVESLFSDYGFHFIPAFFFQDLNTDIDDSVDNMYWVQGRKILNNTMNCALQSNVFPVRATNFNCGSDSMLLLHEEDIIQKSGKPHLVLQTDGHSSNAQFGTRALANMEVVKNYQERSIDPNVFRLKKRQITLKNKIIGIPFMGDNSYILAATFKAMGYNAKVMPTAANDTMKKAVNANICLPFSYQTSDALAWLEGLSQSGINPDTDAVILEPGAKGPCRFGQYHVLLQKVIDNNGYQGVNVLSPDAEKDYANLPLSEREITGQATWIFKGTFCLDILYDALLRTRPYESEAGMADRLYDTLKADLLVLVEKKVRFARLVSFMNQAADRYVSVIDPSIKPKPLVAVNGEIFVRLHNTANNYAIKLLEQYGLETKLSPLSQWIEYVNKNAVEYFRRDGNWKRYFISRIKKTYMSSTGAKLGAPFTKLLAHRPNHDSKHIIDAAHNDLIYHKMIRGESALTIGETYLFSNNKLPEISGVCHIWPFGCMQETAATSQIRSFTVKKKQAATTLNEKVIPFIDAVFGDSELPNLEAEIAVFAEKCYLKQRLQEN